MHEDFFLTFPSQYDYLSNVFNPNIIENEARRELVSLKLLNKIEIIADSKISGLGYYTDSEFDSKILNRKVGKIVKFLARTKESKKKLIQQVLIASKYAEIKYLSFRFPHDIQLIHILEDLQFHYSDSILYMYKTLHKSPYVSQCISTYKESDSLSLLNIASESFLYGRFYSDESVSIHQANEIYREWTKNSLEKRMCDQTYVYRNGLDPIGFITMKILRTNENSLFSVGSIELLCVDGRYRGRGIGKSLLDAAIKYFYLNKIKVALIDTQVINIPAFSLYTKYGFVPGKIFHTYRRIQ